MRPYYRKDDSSRRPETPVELPPGLASSLRDPAGYIPDDGLADAVNVALVLRQPLLVTGEPGTGKSELAASIAWELGLGPPLVFEGKSTSQARDLFYNYDTLGRFTAQQLGGPARAGKDYLTFAALGEAIVRSLPPSEHEDVLPNDFVHSGPQRSVVLIDEIEKAPRDFPNDILNEIERMYFRIPELGNRRIEADPDLLPVVVITNNSEKTLPDAFLRRCVYYDIPFPEPTNLADIVLSRLRNAEAGMPLLNDAIGFFYSLRETSPSLLKRPGTAELLAWLTALERLGADWRQSLHEQSKLARRTFSALAKLGEDQPRVDELFGEWLIQPHEPT